MVNLESLRVIRAVRPDIADKILEAWGRPNFTEMMTGLLRSIAQAPAEIQTLCAMLEQLRDQHQQQFPQFVEADLSTASDEIILNEHFQLINAHFPHIGKRLIRCWAKPEFAQYVNNLMNDTRDGKRKGFPPDIMLALWNLTSDHDKVHPDLQLKIADIWSLNDST